MEIRELPWRTHARNPSAVATRRQAVGKDHPWLLVPGVVSRLGSVRDWLWPTFAGSILGFVLVTLVFRLGWTDEPLMRELARAGALGIGLALSFATVDVVFAGRGIRAIPEGKLAWGMALGGGIVGEILWIIPSWEPLPAAPILLAKLLVTAATVRLIFGRTR